ncbi:hypothetical protein NPIL_90001 [Nephila pilipes]|uniref:Uncharacterized protein n=1 Tax=Nephila pilipes TaxID=299642 RepID=A0A8X6N157_NEPPI|nr:hypothetical protein NPIL_90001 [Nephila pilipes]
MKQNLSSFLYTNKLNSKIFSQSIPCQKTKVTNVIPFAIFRPKTPAITFASESDFLQRFTNASQSTAPNKIPPRINFLINKTHCSPPLQNWILNFDSNNTGAQGNENEEAGGGPKQKWGFRAVSVINYFLIYGRVFVKLRYARKMLRWY